VEAIAYADVFDYPLTPLEVHRYLAGVTATPAAVTDALASPALMPYISRVGCFFALRGRDALAQTRRRRQRVAKSLWVSAHRYATAIGALPFVRLVAVSGALALDNVDAGADIDYFIVTEPGRLWVCRATVITLVRLAARHGVTVCPNYFLSERALELSDRTLFAAHEVTQMVPLGGRRTYHRFRKLNGWTDTFLPNAAGAPRPVLASDRAKPRMRRVAEAVGRTAVGDWIERWEMRRKVRRFSGRPNGNGEASFGPDWCKGHFGGYAERVLTSFTERLRAMELRG
jgi:hypothetical protein